MAERILSSPRMIYIWPYFFRKETKIIKGMKIAMPAIERIVPKIYEWLAKRKAIGTRIMVKIAKINKLGKNPRPNIFQKYFFPAEKPIVKLEGSFLSLALIDLISAPRPIKLKIVKSKQIIISAISAIMITDRC